MKKLLSEFKIFWLIVILISLSIGLFYSYSCWRSGAFTQLDGVLIFSKDSGPWSNNDPRQNAKIYSLGLDNHTGITPYFESNQYQEIIFPSISHGTFICAAKRIDGNYYTVLQIKDNSITELFKSKARIYYPVVLNDRILFGSQNFKQDSSQTKNVGYLLSYDRTTEQVTRVIPDYIFTESKPAVSSDGTILVTTIENINNMKKVIELISPNGSTEKIIEGVFPLWADEGRSFYYYNKRLEAIFCYDILTRNQKLIAFANVNQQPILSPDKKYLVFVGGLPNTYGGEFALGTTVMTVDGWVKKEIRPDNRHMVSYGGIEWIAHNP